MMIDFSAELEVTHHSTVHVETSTDVMMIFSAELEVMHHSAVHVDTCTDDMMIEFQFRT
jgi:hypothetical protein